MPFCHSFKFSFGGLYVAVLQCLWLVLLGVIFFLFVMLAMGKLNPETISSNALCSIMS